MEANPKTPGVILDTVEIVTLMDVIGFLRDTENRAEKREADLKRKSEESGLEIVRMGGLVSADEESYARIASEALDLLYLKHYEELLDVVKDRQIVEEYSLTRHLNPNEINLTRFLMGTFVAVSENELAKQQAGEMLGQLDEKFEESKILAERRE